MKELSVIILNWNGLGLLRQFLPAVVRFTSAPEVEITVADNGSADGSADWVESEFPEVRVIRFDRNLGFAEGYNRAVELTPSPFITLLNSDVEVTEGWWQPILDFLKSNPRAGAVQPKVLSWHNRTRFEYAGGAGGYLDALGYPWCRGRLFDVTETDCGQYDRPEAARTAWASGACLTVRREAYLEVGGLDPLFFAHMEEIDLCVRMQRAGYGVWALSVSKIYHVGGASLNQGNPKKTYLNFRNNLLLLHKNSTSRRGKRILFLRRLADTLALGMYVLKMDWPNARAILKAHRDFRKMRGAYTQLPESDILPQLPGARRHAVAARFLLRRTRLAP